MNIPDDTTPDELAGAVAGLTKHAGWVHFCRRYAEICEEVQATVNNMATPPAETQEHKRVLKMLTDNSPDAIAKDLINSARNAAKRQS